MDTKETIYLRLSLGVKCSSSQLAYSYLDGRLSQEELFQLGGETLSFSQICQRDTLVGKIINGSPKEQTHSKEELEQQVVTLEREIKWLRKICDETVVSNQEAYSLLEALSSKYQGDEYDEQRLRQTALALGKAFKKASITFDDALGRRIPKPGEVFYRVNMITEYCNEIEEEFKREIIQLLELEDQCKEAIENEKERVTKILQKDIETREILRINLRECSKEIREYVNNEFPNDGHYCYSVKVNDDRKELKDKIYSAIKSYASDVAPDDVVALFDSTFWGKADKGILISYKAIYIFDGSTTRDANGARIKNIQILPIKPQYNFAISPASGKIKLLCEDECLATFNGNCKIRLKEFCEKLNKMCKDLFMDFSLVYKINNVDFTKQNHQVLMDLVRKKSEMH